MGPATTHTHQPCQKGKGQYPVTTRVGSCSSGSFCPQTKASSGKFWVHPNLLMLLKCRGLEHAKRCLTVTYSRIPACSGKLCACSKCTGKLDTFLTLTLLSLPDVSFSLCKSTLHDAKFPLLKGSSNSPLYITF